MQLDLSKNALTELPKDFGNLSQLKRLDLYSNQLSFLPLSCVSLKELRWLDLKNNPIQTLWPEVIGNCLSEEECRQCAVNVSTLRDVYIANDYIILQGCLIQCGRFSDLTVSAFDSRLRGLGSSPGGHHCIHHCTC